MRKTKGPRRRLVIRITSGTALLAALAATMPMVAMSAAAEDPGASAPEQARGIPVRAGIGSIEAGRLADRLGAGRHAGVYFDQKTQRMVVTVTDDAAAREVRNAGGLAEQVTYSLAELEAVTSALEKSIDTPGTTWGTDIDDNRIHVTADRTVSDAEYAEMKAVLEPFGDAARLIRTDGKLQLDGPVNGGKAIRSEDGVRCTAGFNVRKKADPSQKYLLTAGHCTDPDPKADWFNGAGTRFGYGTGSYFPGRDHGIIRHYSEAVSNPGNVYTHGTPDVIDITHSRDPGQGEAVCISGQTTGGSCGVVYALDVTANYDSGDVHGLFMTDLCTEGGDSGGPIFHNNAALGIHSGNGGSCVGYHQRVNPALAWYNVEVY